ncbi:MAG: hypothetical protein WAN86_24430 [Hyphomicrobiaceae bacterium]
MRRRVGALPVIGPNGADARVLEVAHALEQALAADPATARPVPEWVRLAT